MYAFPKAEPSHLRRLGRSPTLFFSGSILGLGIGGNYLVLTKTVLFYLS
jgi:hypothetical protein